MSKTLGENLREVLDQVVQMVNFIKTKPVNHAYLSRFVPTWNLIMNDYFYTPM